MSLEQYARTNFTALTADSTELKARVCALEEASKAYEAHGKQVSQQIAGLQLSVVVFKQLIGKEHEHEVDILNELNKVIKKTTDELSAKIGGLEASSEETGRRIDQLADSCRQSTCASSGGQGCGKVGEGSGGQGAVDPSIINEINIRIDGLSVEVSKAAECKKSFDELRQADKELRERVTVLETSVKGWKESSEKTNSRVEFLEKESKTFNEVTKARLDVMKKEEKELREITNTIKVRVDILEKTIKENAKRYN